MHPKVDICIVTQLHPSSNPRVVKEADTLTEAGYSVAVIAPNFSTWHQEADKELEGRAWRIVERPQFGPLSSTATRFAELTRRLIAGFAVRTLGATSPKVVLSAWNPVAPLLVHAAVRQPASLYIGHLAGLAAAAIAAKQYGAKYAYDAEDFHPGDLPDTPEFAIESQMVRTIEAHYLPECAYMTAASPGIADSYSAEYRIRRPTVILNTFPQSRAPNHWTRAGTAQPAPSIYWFSQTIGTGRGIECAISALGQSRSQPHLYLRGILVSGFRQKLEDLAREVGVADRVHFLAPASPLEMETLAAQFDIGLSGETGFSPNNRIALGNKLFSYLLAGIPILMSDTPAHRNIATELGEAARTFPINDEMALAAAADSLLLNPASLARSRKAAWNLGQTRFNWAVDASRLIAIVRCVLGSPQEVPFSS